MISTQVYKIKGWILGHVPLLVLTTIILILLALGTSLRAYANLQGQQEKTMGELKNTLEQNIQLQETIIEKDKVIEEQEIKIEDLDTRLKQAQARKLQLARVNPAQLSDEIKTLTAKYGKQYGVSETLLNCIVVKESGGRYNAVGDGGRAHGVAQYHLATFLGHRKALGLSQEDLRFDPEASIQAMAFSISRGGARNWTVYPACTSVL